MNKKNLEQLILEAIDIISKLGIPVAMLSSRRKVRMGKAFLALCGMTTSISWHNVKSLKDNHALLSRDIIRYMNQYLEEKIADSSYDDIRRKDLIFLVEAGIVLKAATKKTANTNDGTRRYALSDEAAEVICRYSKEDFTEKLNNYLQIKGTLAAILERERLQNLIPVSLPTGEKIVFSNGIHNQLQRSIIEDFLSRFGHNAELLYVGDSADKFLYLKSERLKEIGFFEISNDKLPDIIAYSESKKWLFLIEAVHTSNPINEMRKLVFDRLTSDLETHIIYVSAFKDRNTFRKFAQEIAWETEVWIAENPTHMIHYNGDKFLEAYSI